MFKKAVDVRGQQRLSGADRKKLRKALRETFSHAQDSDLDLVLPPKVSQLTCQLAALPRQPLPATASTQCPGESPRLTAGSGLAGSCVLSVSAVA